jgi:hypothetical protein
MQVLSLDNSTIMGYEFIVTGEQPLPDEDLSAQSSSTLTAEQGFKGKRLRVSMKIKYDDSQQLKALVALATAINESGKRKVYTISNQTADAFGVRQVRFSERLTSQELNDSQAWSVSFVLLEHKSVPEKREAKMQVNEQPVSAPADEKVESMTLAQADESFLEKYLLAPLDSSLGRLG